MVSGPLSLTCDLFSAWNWPGKPGLTLVVHYCCNIFQLFSSEFQPIGDTIRTLDILCVRNRLPSLGCILFIVYLVQITYVRKSLSR